MKRLIFLILILGILFLSSCGISAQPTADIIIKVTGTTTVFDNRKYEDLLHQELEEVGANFQKIYPSGSGEKGSAAWAEYQASGKSAEFDKKLRDKYKPLQDACFTESPAVHFSGNYMIIDSTGASISRSVEGITPMEYIVKASMVSCAFQKQEESGFLKVEIMKSNKIISSSSTSAKYGIVSIATN